MYEFKGSMQVVKIKYLFILLTFPMLSKRIFNLVIRYEQNVQNELFTPINFISHNFLYIDPPH